MLIVFLKISILFFVFIAGCNIPIKEIISFLLQKIMRVNIYSVHLIEVYGSKEYKTYQQYSNEGQTSIVSEFAFSDSLRLNVCEKPFFKSLTVCFTPR